MPWCFLSTEGAWCEDVWDLWVKLLHTSQFPVLFLSWLNQIISISLLVMLCRAPGTCKWPRASADRTYTFRLHLGCVLFPRCLPKHCVPVALWPAFPEGMVPKSEVSEYSGIRWLVDSLLACELTLCPGYRGWH